MINKNFSKIDLEKQLSLFIFGLCAVLSILMVILSCIWILVNYNHIPLYGDTAEYIALSETLKVDQYRGIVYPLILHFSQEVSTFLNIRSEFVSVIYFVQLILLVSSSIIFCTSLFNTFINGQLNYKYGIICGVVASLNPLTLHFTFTVLADSISASLIMIQATCLIFAKKRNLDIKNFIIWLIIWSLITVVLSNLRVEKQYLSLLVFVIFGIFLILDFKQKMHLYKCLLLISVFMITFLAISSIRSISTIPNPDRPNLSVANLLFNRAVWPRLTNTLPYLPESISHTITIEQAKDFDSHNNNVFPFQATALNDPSKGSNYLNTITLTTVKKFYPEIICSILFDFGKYLLPGLAFPLEAIGVLPESPATSWTISRATMASPKLTSTYLLIGSLFYFSLIALVIIKRKEIFLLVKKTQGALGIVVVYLVANSALFALAFGQDAHIRYSLPTYILTLNVLLVFSIATVFSPRNQA